MFFKNRGFTESEQKIILFLVVSLCVGSGIRLYQSRWAPLPEPLLAADQPVEIEAESEQPVNQEVQKDRVTDKLMFSEKININLATKEELTNLPGIGNKTAEQIIQFRVENGKFYQPEDLMKIKGIGPKKFNQIRDKIII